MSSHLLIEPSDAGAGQGPGTHDETLRVAQCARVAWSRPLCHRRCHEAGILVPQKVSQGQDPCGTEGVTRYDGLVSQK